MTQDISSSPAQRLMQIQTRLECACLSAQRSTNSVRLIGVSKTKSIAEITNFHQWGLMDFGENYIQEWQEKKKALADYPIHWHFIGRLQKNKIKFLVDGTTLIHSINDGDALKKINQLAEQKGLIQPLLLQVQSKSDINKAGFSEKQLFAILKEAPQFTSVAIKGFMTIGQATDNLKTSQQDFRDLAQLLREAQKIELGHHALTELSMGMSRDFEIAIQEGATLIRVGSDLFGTR